MPEIDMEIIRQIEDKMLLSFAQEFADGFQSSRIHNKNSILKTGLSYKNFQS